MTGVAPVGADGRSLAVGSSRGPSASRPRPGQERGTLQVAATRCLTALALGMALSGAFAAPAWSAAKPPTPPPPVAAAQQGSRASLTWHSREGALVERNWGVDLISVRRVSSGYMLRLSYRVVDAEKAKPLFDKKVRPFIIDEVTGARLAVPAMENVGELRQTAAPVDDRTYFMIFGNPEKLVKSGGRVSIVLGDMRVDGFTVD